MVAPRVTIEIVSSGRERVAAEIRDLERQAASATGSQSRFAQQAAEAGRAGAAEARSIGQAGRELDNFRRAAATASGSQERLNQSVRAGATAFSDSGRRIGDAGRGFRSASGEADRLRLGLVGVREELLRMAAVRVPGGGLLAGLGAGRLGGGAGLGLALGAGGLGVLAAGAGVAGLGSAGENIQLRQFQIEALGGTAEIIDDIVDSSLELGISVDANIDLFRRLTLANDSLGRSEQELLAFTERLNQAIVVSGTSTTQASAGILQLGQALASGRLQGDEFRSVLENIPVVGRAIARGLVEMGVATRGTVGEMRALSTQGTLTADLIFEAFLRGSEDVEQAFESMPNKVGRSITRIRDALGEMAGLIGQSTGATNALQEAWDSVADSVVGALERVREFLQLQDVQAGRLPISEATAGVQERVLSPENLEQQRARLAAARTALAEAEQRDAGQVGPRSFVGNIEDVITELLDGEQALAQVQEERAALARAEIDWRRAEVREIENTIQRLQEGITARTRAEQEIVDVRQERFALAGRPLVGSNVGAPPLKPLTDAQEEQAQASIAASDALEKLTRSSSDAADALMQRAREQGTAISRGHALALTGMVVPPDSAAVARAQAQIERIGVPQAGGRADAMAGRAAELGIRPPPLSAAGARELESFDRMNALLDDVQASADRFTSSFAQGLANVALEADNVSDAIDGFLRSFLASGVQEAMHTLLTLGSQAAIGAFRPQPGAGAAGGGAGAGGPTQLSPFFSQHGLSMTVPGSGPPDSRLFASMVSPGEHIQITPAAQLRQQAAMMSRLTAQSSGSGPQFKVEVIDQRGANAPPVEQQQEQLANGMTVLRAIIREESNATLQNAFQDGRMNSQMAAFGGRRAPVRR